MTHWRGTFLETVKADAHRERLRDAAATQKLKPWTAALTTAMVDVCKGMHWDVAARGYPCKTMPVRRGEYLAVDVTAFEQHVDGGARWRFPLAAFELENQLHERFIAYSFWKVLNVRARHRAVFCYRAKPEDAAELVARIETQVVDLLSHGERMSLSGDQWLVVGNRGANETFPYGFFKFFLLDKNDGHFHLQGA